jgi:glycosyltransferase involved in cell wall biosynthesis
MVSLVVATLNRVTELERLLTSLDRQSYRDFEVIVVDQNPDERLVSILGQHPGLNIQHLRCRPGASRARNLGLRAAKGKIVAFPDDDCWYPEHLLEEVSEWFASHLEFGGLFAILRGPDNRRVGPKSPPYACRCTRANLFDCGSTPNGFLRREVTVAIGFFDERIGLGAPSQYQSGEDVDYFLRSLERGFHLWYDPEITVHHPDFHAIDRVRQRAYSYALGGGYVMRAHGKLKLRFARAVIRSFGGAIVRLLQGDWQRSRAYLLSTVGLLRGYVFGPRDVRRVRLQEDLSPEPIATCPPHSSGAAARR